MKKRGRKTGGSINKKPPKLDEKTRRKNDLQGVKNLQNLARKTGRKTEYWLIEDRDESLDQKVEHNIHI